MFRPPPRRPPRFHTPPPPDGPPVLPYRDPDEDRADDLGPSNREVLRQYLGEFLAHLLLGALCLAIFLGYVNLRGCLPR